MIFDVQTVKKLERLVHPEIEEAIILLLDTTLAQKDDEIHSNPNSTDAQLRMFAGQKLLIKELKQYRARLKDSIKREQEKEEDGRLNK